MQYNRKVKKVFIVNYGFIVEFDNGDRLFLSESLLNMLMNTSRKNQNANFESVNDEIIDICLKLERKIIEGKENENN